MKALKQLVMDFCVFTIYEAKQNKEFIIGLIIGIIIGKII